MTCCSFVHKEKKLVIISLNIYIQSLTVLTQSYLHA